MSYILQWRSPGTFGKTNITVPVGSTVSNAASLTLTGKGAANYGQTSQQNLLRLLENFAGSAAPDFATVGQTWFDTSTSTLKVFADNSPATWKSIGGIQVRNTAEGPPLNPQIGDLWVEVTGALSCYLYVFNGIGRFPYSTTTNGGWSQIWPKVEEVGLRQEYDQVVSLARSLATDLSFLDGRLFTHMPNMTALDADLEAKRLATPDAEVNLTGVTGLQAQPVSYDWDELLSIARWLVSRLDVPLDTWQDVTDFPFVQDGRQVQSYLLEEYSFFDPRYVLDPRRASRKLGSITLHRLYAETVNVLAATQPFRYSLRGISGGSGTNSSFSPDVVTGLHCRVAGSWAGGTAAANTVFRWASADDRDRFVAGGSAIEVTARLVGGASAADVALNSFLNQRGRIRVTADFVRWMDASATPVMQVAPAPSGLLNIMASAGVVAVGSQSDAGNSLALSGQRTAAGFNLTLTVGAPVGITGTLQVTYAVIQDKTTYDTTELKLYPPPLAFNSSTDLTGTAVVLANAPVAAPPIANFTANGNTGPNAFSTAVNALVNFVFTGAGAPTLIEWDFDGDGAFTATGPTASHAYPAGGVFSPRVRVTNAGGSDVLFRPAMIRVS